MTRRGNDSGPVRVAIIGSGPAGFYTAEKLLKQEDVAVEVDMYDRLPVPFGLVRFGVAPDHEKIKRVTRIYEKVAGDPRFRFFGNVDIGRHLTLDDLRRHYHQICFSTGAQTDRSLNIPGEDLERSHAATEFVAWYNGHPDYTGCEFDLSAEKVAVIGVGNVAVDVARILCRNPDELRTTDIADYALDALAASGVKEVYMLGRRGPAQAAFTNPEVRELGELEGADIRAVKEEVDLDPLSRKRLEEDPDKETSRKLEILESFVGREPTGKPKTLTLRFLVSPVEIYDDGKGGVGGMKLVHNELYESEDGSLRPRPTDVFEDLDVDMVFRSVGYRGVPVAGVPFHERWGIIPNVQGRVIDPESDGPLTGLYVSGWIKRGPSGVIGTNKPDAAETVERMLEDARADAVLEPSSPDPESAERTVCGVRPDCVSWEDWKRIQAVEDEAGKKQGRPRVKLTSLEEMLAALKE
ncbi:MAG: FAD-dependent oxidoreductase [Gemmatimonadetes bacterium]|uniref:FAD-dependent oxidoreductase n=1 Tax=Candidatus Kutchimonas denitrificans TaxID=3056748 RepID=A0AAE4Z6T5_9BACT|nr:FAD-dependent oxidoreductase [Gemmatimonadota bacterium]NIR74663.1 FAD-dependent oxidoreductase [Candidatus Kutchimonas denitrificans]NIS01413.1 FAD-dependent oxidoreductase [Gemmatimonadota bacterium]NIT67154.1 FAD-dependent oxidoreductase [Gemmatimonadota bacterium]NIU52328.1 FAD-dependent oxidoreductase [Gemmatimonadota bacterium]